jgi:hypothetical protein
VQQSRRGVERAQRSSLREMSWNGSSSRLQVSATHADGPLRAATKSICFSREGLGCISAIREVKMKIPAQGPPPTASDRGAALTAGSSEAQRREFRPGIAGGDIATKEFLQNWFARTMCAALDQRVAQHIRPLKCGKFVVSRGPEAYVLYRDLTPFWSEHRLQRSQS